MSATVCFVLVASLQCHAIANVTHWPAEGMGARVCSDTSDGFRCQSISRQDGFELVRQYQCRLAQSDEHSLPKKTKWNETERQARISWARTKLQMAQQAVNEWEKHPPRRPSHPTDNFAYADDFAYKQSLLLRDAAQKRVVDAQDELVQAIKAVESGRQDDARTVADAQARIAKWCTQAAAGK